MLCVVILCTRGNTESSESWKWKKRKIRIVLEVLLEVSITFLETEGFMQQKTRKKCSRDKILVVEVIFLLLLHLIANGSLFLWYAICLSLTSQRVVFLSFTTIYGLLCNKSKSSKGSCKETSLEGKSQYSKHLFYCRVSDFEAGTCFITKIAFN